MKIYWDYINQKIVSSLNSKVEVSRFQFILRDYLPIELYAVTEQSNINVPYVAGEFAADLSINFGAKKESTYPTDTEFLFNQNTWTKTGSGTSAKYSANIPLGTDALIAAIGSGTSLDCKAEFVLVDGSNNHQYSTQVTFRILYDVYRGTEGTGAANNYPVVVQYTSEGGIPSVRLVNSDGVCVGLFRNGAPYVYCAVSGYEGWYPLSATVNSGIVVPAFGAKENI